MSIDTGRYGIWLRADEWSAELASAAEDLGFGTLWIGGSPDGDLADAERLLAATEHVLVGTSIVNVWKDDAATVAASVHRLAERFPGRFLLGVGIGHPEAQREYASPYQSLVDYLDALDAAGVAPEQRALAALGPRVLRLAGERTAGALPYLTTPEHTARARAELGDGVLLAPEHKIALQQDPAAARDVARQAVALYLRLSNYTRNLKTLGFSDADIADGGSDRLLDELVYQGPADAVAARLERHLAAGADHVAVHPQFTDGDDRPGQLRELAAALGL
ncbi:TIGR03620 family F420-dependent LLM class oxidoreductase [Desertihabitans brevis]|uniref:TIGR03620 family F420-dependent LLM class oxidoreductase n=1 Tax=Desertihabitans brevis TaxID=2268447 RepID=A0A367YST4_9ACTN|nr:TIGR03620 family F420-dependent LLM class oxidoreductase [Desertihabitans brevis]RCK68943.1 TIGR03620 family F420-dependent LLM class oxidoreductase [Desertihabitans brevis]